MLSGNIGYPNNKVYIAGTETIEQTVLANWNRWSRKSVQQRHVLITKQLFNSIYTSPGFLGNSNADTIASQVLSSRSYGLVPRWVVHCWHEVSGDTRGAWLAIFYLTKPLCIGGLLLLAVPSAPIKIAGVVLAAASATFGIIAGKVLKIGANTTRPFTHIGPH